MSEVCDHPVCQAYTGCTRFRRVTGEDGQVTVQQPDPSVKLKEVPKPTPKPKKKAKKAAPKKKRAKRKKKSK